MTAPSGTQDFDNAVDAIVDLATRLKAAMAETGPGGKTITLNEILDGVTDGHLRTSITTLMDEIEKIVHGEHVNVFELVESVGAAVLDLVGHLRDALADGRVTPDEIVSTVTDGHIRKSLLDAINGASKIPAELTSMSPWAMIGTFQRIMGKILPLLQK